MARLLSVIMPVYNGASYVEAAIDSVLRQTFADFELLVMDDGSTDDTPSILKLCAERDRRIRLFPRPRQGQVACRNELLQLAGSDIVACADADDICLPQRFERQLAALVRDSDLWVLGTAVVSIDGKGRRRRPRRVTTGSAEVAAELERGCCVGHPSCMMRRERILDLGGYRPAYEAAEDYDLFLRASERGKVDNLPEAGVLYREHAASVSHLNGWRQALSADLARATHLRRVGGMPDPTAGLVSPPGIDDPLLAELLTHEQLELHRAMAVTANPGAGKNEIDWALRYFLHAPIGKKQARLSQRAIVHLMGRRRWDYPNVKAAVRAVLLGPGRLARLLLRRPGFGRAPISSRWP